MKNIKLSEPSINANEIRSVTKVLKSGWLTSGKVTQSFEKLTSKYLNSKNVIACNSCTNGILATLKALNLKKGAEVITSPFTFVSTINTIHQLGLKIKFADINLSDLNIDPNDLKNKISKKTKCILITHYGGNPCDLQSIYKICPKNVYLIEDSATALGAEYKRNKIGSFNNSISIFSLYANKIITTAEGGLISTNNNQLAKKIRTLISIGIDKTPWKRNNQKFIYKYDLKYPGYKFNFTDLQASLGIEQLKKLDKIISKRKKIRKKYNIYLNSLVKKNYISLFEETKNTQSAEYIYTILIKNQNFSRDKLIQHLYKKKIATSVHYIPAIYLTYYKKLFKKNNLINTKYAYNNIVSIPFHNNLKENEIRYVSKEILNFFNNENK
jgi:dTDP-4-amino-4,6-dideoxygalactose transaminase